MSERRPDPPRPVSAPRRKQPRRVREGMPGDIEPPEIAIESREIQIDDTLWTVSVRGRGGVGRAGTTTPVLDLVFRAETEEARQALAVGRALEVLTEDQLLDAFRVSRTDEPDRAAPGFFEGTEQGGPGSRR